jgi:hypothetical protein
MNDDEFGRKQLWQGIVLERLIKVTKKKKLCLGCLVS